jgi:hypothetical protein
MGFPWRVGVWLFLKAWAVGGRGFKTHSRAVGPRMRPTCPLLPDAHPITLKIEAVCPSFFLNKFQ